MVITKGAGRIAEVAARFTLDAMPGRQMSIDADLGAGLIDETEARRRREEISRYADFYGSMDGAAKFVRGDAVAGLVITAINLVGGFVIGMTQHGHVGRRGAHHLQLAHRRRRPRHPDPGADREHRGRHARDLRLLAAPRWRPSIGAAADAQPARALDRGAAILAPASPSCPACRPLPFLVLARRGRRWPGLSPPAGAGAPPTGGRSAAEAAEATPALAGRPPLRELLAVEPLETRDRLRADPARGRDAAGRPAAARRHHAQAAGLRARHDRAAGAHPRQHPARPPTSTSSSCAACGSRAASCCPATCSRSTPPAAARRSRGSPTTDPSFGLPAVWIAPEQRDQAEAAGYTVVEAADRALHPPDGDRSATTPPSC